VRRRRSWAIRVLARVNNASSRVWGFIVDILRVTRKIFLSRRILSLTEPTVLSLGEKCTENTEFYRFACHLDLIYLPQMTQIFTTGGRLVINLRSGKLEFFAKSEVATVAKAWDNIFM
jgi:hypothetical protein